MEDLVAGHLIIPGADLEERFETAGGPGGQHANRTETAVRLRLNIAKSSLPDPVKKQLLGQLGKLVEATASEERSQARNRETARRRLAEKIESALHEDKPRKQTKPTRASRERRLAQKKARSDIKHQRRSPRVGD
jgi:ribosome-associated protein